MANSTDIIVSSGETLTIVPQNIEYLAKNGEQYTIVFANGTSKIVSNQAFESVKALDYSGGGNDPRVDTLSADVETLSGNVSGLSSSVSSISGSVTSLNNNLGFTQTDYKARFNKAYNAITNVPDYRTYITCNLKDKVTVSDYSNETAQVTGDAYWCGVGIFGRTDYYLYINLTGEFADGDQCLLNLDSLNATNWNNAPMPYIYLQCNGTEFYSGIDWSYQGNCLKLVYSNGKFSVSYNVRGRIQTKTLTTCGKELIDTVSTKVDSIGLKYSSNGEILDSSEQNIVCGVASYEDAERKIKSVKSANGEIVVYEDLVENNKQLRMNDDILVQLDNESKELTVFGESIKGGSSMVYNTTDGSLTGAKDQDGNDVTLNVNTITISF